MGAVLPTAGATSVPAAGTASVQACLEAAEALQRRGQENEALARCEEALRQDPGSTRAARRLAVLCDRQGQDERALELYHRLLRDHPDDATLHNDLGYFHYQRGQWADAEKWLRQAVANDPGLARAWVNLGLALGHQGRYPESHEAFARAVGPAEAQSNLGVVLARQGKRAEAAQALGQALALDPGLKQARSVLARVQGRPEWGTRMVAADSVPPRAPATASLPGPPATGRLAGGSVSTGRPELGFRPAAAPAAESR
jgi:Tfp pilus assembly protein PilF